MTPRQKRRGESVRRDSSAYSSAHQITAPEPAKFNEMADFRERSGFAGGGALTAKSRNALPGSDFALSGRRYPVNDANHARNALSRVSQFGTAEQKAAVRAKVHRKYPDIGKG